MSSLLQGLRYTHRAHTAAPVQRPKASVSSPTESLSADYHGPVLVVAEDALFGPGARLAAHAQETLETVAHQGVPIFYLPQTGKVAIDTTSLPDGPRSETDAVSYIQGLQRQLPQARMFALLSNQGPTVKAATLPGVTTYLRNNDPTQKDMPAGFKGILTDEYYDVFRARLAADLQGTAPTPPMYANAPPVHAPTLADKLWDLGAKAVWLGHGVQMQIAGAIHQRAQDGIHARTVPQDPVAATPTEIASAIAGLNRARLGSQQRSEQVFKLVTSHGTDIGHIDSILSRIDTGRVRKALRGEQLAEFDRLRSSQAAVPGDWDGFETYMDGLTGTVMRPGNRVKVLIDGDEAFSEKLHAMSRAKLFTALATFVLGADQFGRHFVRTLEDSVRRGVSVPFMNDPVGSEFTYDTYKTDPNLVAGLKQHPNCTYLETRPSAFSGHLNHRKIMSMDNGESDGRHVGFIGCMNTDNHYRINWHDVHTKVEGPAVTDINRLLLQQMELNDPTGEAANRYRTMLDRPQEAFADGSNVRIVGHVGRRDHDIKLAYLRAIETAEHTIDMSNPYVGDPDIMNAIIRRAKAGVKVRLFVPHHNDQNYMQWSARTWYHDLLQTGHVQIYEYDGHAMAHEKVAVFDGKITTIGSSNLDARSMSDNEEANLWSNDPAIAADVTRRLFDADVPKSVQIHSSKAGLTARLEDEAATLLRGEL